MCHKKFTPEQIVALCNDRFIHETYTISTKYKGVEFYLVKKEKTDTQVILEIEHPGIEQRIPRYPYKASRYRFGSGYSDDLNFLGEEVSKVFNTYIRLTMEDVTQ